MWISADYYPGTNDSTQSDKGYEWTPEINGGHYTYFEWWAIKNPVPASGWHLQRGESREVWYPGGGPALPDPYEPTLPPDNPVPTIIKLDCKIYVAGHSVPLIDNVYESTTAVTAVVAPLIIGPVT